MHSCSSPIFIKIKYLGYEAQLRVRLEELGLKVLPLLNMCLVMRAPPLYDTVVRCFRRGFFLGVKGEAITGSGTLEVVFAFNTFGLLLSLNYLRSLLMNRKLNRNKLPKFELILAFLLYLLAQYVTSRKEIPQAGSEHFRLIHPHPDRESKILRNVGKILHLQWRGLTNRLWSTLG